MDAEELLLGARDRDVGESALLFEVVGIVRGLNAREDSVLKAGQEDDREFESLRAVDCHHDDRVGRFVVIIDVADQRDVFEEAREIRLGIVFLVLDGV